MRGPREEAGSGDHRLVLLRGGERAWLARVLDLGVDELLRPGLDRVGEAQQRKLALRGRGIAPFREGAGGCGVGAIDILLARDGRLRVDLAGGRVDDVRVAAGVRLTYSPLTKFLSVRVAVAAMVPPLPECRRMLTPPAGRA